jgi:multiple sugar transport system ATP-binding protein
MTVYQNMAFGLELRKVPKAEIERRVNETAKMLAIETYLKRKPKELSGGQRQRVALGRAIVREPQVFLMDEPLSNLDAQLRVQTRAEIVKLHRRLGITTIYVTHDQVEAMTMGTRIAVMKDGILQQCDKPMSIYAHPVNMFVAGFIGTPSMNFLPAKLVQNGAATTIDGGGFKLTLPEDKAALAQTFLDKDVVLGVRPADLFDSDLPISIPATSGNMAVANVDVVEPMGDICTIYLTAGGNQIIATINSETKAKEGQPLNLAFDMSKIHVFDPTTELALF